MLWAVMPLWWLLWQLLATHWHNMQKDISDITSPRCPLSSCQECRGASPSLSVVSWLWQCAATMRTYFTGKLWPLWRRDNGAWLLLMSVTAWSRGVWRIIFWPRHYCIEILLGKCVSTGASNEGSRRLRKLLPSWWRPLLELSHLRHY